MFARHGWSESINALPLFRAPSFELTALGTTGGVIRSRRLLSDTTKGTDMTTAFHVGQGPPARVRGPATKPWSARVACVLAALAAGACVGEIGGTTGGADSRAPNSCDPVLDQRVTRLSDRHIAKALAELLAIPPPSIETGALSADAFIPGKAAIVNGAVATKLQEVAEVVAAAATEAGQAIASCAGAEQDCAAAFIDDFASRAFRRPLRDQERTDLLAVFNVGRQTDESYAGGVSLVIEAVVQSPSFIYMAELGTPSGTQFTLTGYEIAARLGIFLRDGLPDQALWEAAKSGKLDTEEGLASEVDRLLEDSAVRENLSEMFSRFFQLGLIPTLERSEPDFPELAEAMHAEAEQLVTRVLWENTGTLSELLTSREAYATPALAELYGVAPPAAAGTVMLPEEQRAGILTRAGVMAARAEEDTTSVVFRGLMVARGLLCVETPSPPASLAAQIEALKAEELTERQRAEKRAATQPCGSCHAFFDPFGVTFENYDATGRWRTTIDMPSGEVAVDASQDIDISDINGHFANAVQLSEILAQSGAVRDCMSRQIASYAIGEKLNSDNACKVAAVAEKFEASGGDLRKLIREIALWPALRTRRAVAP